MNTKSKKVVKNCPVCGSRLLIRKLECPNCATAISGFFEFDRLFSLPQEKLDFLLTFIKNRGSIKDVEKELNISYPTVRAKLDQVLLALGFPVNKDQEQIASAQKDILVKLESGQIDAKKALEDLKDINE